MEVIKDYFRKWQNSFIIPPEPPPPPPEDPCEGLTGSALKICRGEPPPEPEIPPRPPGDISTATRIIQNALDELRKRIMDAYSSFCAFFEIPTEKKEISLSDLIKYV